MFTCGPSLPPSPEVVSNVILCHVSCLDCPVDYCLVNLRKLKGTFDSTNNSGLNSETVFSTRPDRSLSIPLGHISCKDLLNKMQVDVLTAVSCFMQRNFTRIHDYFRQTFPWYLPDRLKWFSCDERNLRNFIGRFMQTAQIPAGNSERPVYIFPEN